jgi:hypothetical protein
MAARRKVGPPPAKFIQILATPNAESPPDLFALDSAGVVWVYDDATSRVAWFPLTSKRGK